MRLLVLLLLFTPGLLHAGAWARGEGETFATVALEARSSGAVLTFYGERGLSEWLTVGIDGFITDTDKSLTAVAFARYTFPSQGPNVWAISGGLGGEYRTDTLQQQAFAGAPIVTVESTRAGAFLRLGAHYGRGLDNGWIAADFSYDYGVLLSLEVPPLPDAEIERAKLDLTYGRRINDRLSVIGQVFLQDYDGTALQSVQLGAAYAFGKTTFEAGLRQGLGPSSETTLKLGLWRSF